MAFGFQISLEPGTLFSLMCQMPFKTNTLTTTKFVTLQCNCHQHGLNSDLISSKMW